MGPHYHKLPAVKIDKEKLVFPVKLVAKPVSGDGASFHWDIPLNAWVVEVVREPEYGHYEITGYMALKGNRLVVAEIGDGHEGLDADSLVTVPLERIERKKRKYLQTALGRSHYGIPFHMSVTGDWKDDANPNHDGGYEILKDQDARVYPRVKIVNKEVGEISDPGETTWEVLSIPTHTLGTIATDLLAWAEERALDPSEYLYRVGKKAKRNPARLYSNKPGVLTAFHEQLSGGVHKGVRPSMVVPDSPLLLEGEPYWRGRLWADTDRRSADTGFVYILRLRSGVFAFTGQITNVGRNVPFGIGRSWWLITLAQLKDYQPGGRGVLPDVKRAIGTLHLPLRNHSGTSTRRVVRKGLISVANEAIRWAEEMVMPPDEYLYWGGRSRPLQNPKKNPQRGGAGILFIHGKKMLLMRRSSQVKNPGQWGIPGGGAERGESSLQTAIRETEEEAGRQAAAYVAHGKKGLSGTVRYFHGPVLFGAAFTTFLCLVPKEFKPKLNWEHDDWKWVTRQQADRMNLHKGVRKMLKEGI